MLEQLRLHPALTGAEKTVTLISTYFDTPDRRLSRNGIMLRVRDDEGIREQTLKLASPGYAAISREEWNAPAKSEIPDPADFPARAHKLLAQLLERTPLEPVAITRIERTIRLLRLDSATVSVAFDFGMIEAGDRRESVCELELELVQGSPCDLFQLALSLPLGPELTWSVRSKAERCHALASGQTPTIVRASPINLWSGMTIVSGFQAIGWNCLGHLLANYPLVIESGDPKALHQCRVAIRRLRAAFKLFADVVADDESSVVRAEFKAAADGLATARDMHVLLLRLAQTPKPDGGEHDSELLDHVSAQRNVATQSAQTMLADAPFQRLLFQFAHWLECGAWLARSKETGEDDPLVPFAIGVLTRKRSKLRRARGHLANMSDKARHRVRIQAKELRYAAEFYADLFPDKAACKKQRGLSRSLANLQDSLGELNDMAVAANKRSELFAGSDPIIAARLEAQMEQLLSAEATSRRHQIKTAERALEKACNRRWTWWKQK